MIKDYMNFLGRLLHAVDDVKRAHKDAQTQSEYLYYQGMEEAYTNVVNWIKECEDERTT